MRVVNCFSLCSTPLSCIMCFFDKEHLFLGTLFQNIKRASLIITNQRAHKFTRIFPDWHLLRSLKTSQYFFQLLPHWISPGYAAILTIHVYIFQRFLDSVSFSAVFSMFDLGLPTFCSGFRFDHFDLRGRRGKTKAPANSARRSKAARKQAGATRVLRAMFWFLNVFFFCFSLNWKSQFYDDLNLQVEADKAAVPEAQSLAQAWFVMTWFDQHFN